MCSFTCTSVSVTHVHLYTWLKWQLKKAVKNNKISIGAFAFTAFHCIWDKFSGHCLILFLEHLKHCRILCTNLMKFHYMPSMVDVTLSHWFQEMGSAQRLSVQCKIYSGTWCFAMFLWLYYLLKVRHIRITVLHVHFVEMGIKKETVNHPNLACVETIMQNTLHFTCVCENIYVEMVPNVHSIPLFNSNSHMYTGMYFFSLCCFSIVLGILEHQWILRNWI